MAITKSLFGPARTPVGSLAKVLAWCAALALVYVLYAGFFSSTPDADLRKLQEGSYRLTTDGRNGSVDAIDSRFAEVALHQDQSGWVLLLEKTRCLIDKVGNFECDKGYDSRGHLFGEDGSLVVQLSPGSTYFTTAPKHALYYSLNVKPKPEIAEKAKSEVTGAAEPSTTSRDLAAEAAEPNNKTHSADALIKSFENKTPLRGTVVSVRDTVVEVTESEVVFKSSGNDKVICDLGKRNRPAASLKGSVVTVSGRVKGRGMLGNVTLEECAVR
jgi:hypothetical protein